MNKRLLLLPRYKHSNLYLKNNVNNRYITIIFVIAVYLFTTQPLISQTQNKQLDNLIKNYHDLFESSQIILSELDSEISKNSTIWRILYQNSNKTIYSPSEDIIQDFKPGFSELGLKWVSDITHNFKTGLSESEDLFYRSRFSTGLDWVILGEGSWQKNKEDLSNFQKRLQRDSLISHKTIENASLKNKFGIIQYIFDQHRIQLLYRYSELLHTQYQHKVLMHNAELISSVDVLKSKKELEEITQTIELIQRYSIHLQNREILNEYWDLPYGYDDLPEISELFQNHLLQNEEKLMLLEKELLMAQKKSSEKPSLRAKFRYNYYESPELDSRTFSSIGASLSIPITLNKRNQILDFEIKSLENDFEYKKNQIRDELIDRHRTFYTTKKKLDILVIELDYIKALLDQELKVFKEMTSDFYPTKYIEYANEYINKKLEILDTQQQLCEQYMYFYALSGIDTAKNSPLQIQTSKTILQPKEIEKVEYSTYIWRNYFDNNTNEDIIRKLNETNIKRVFLSTSNEEKVTDFIQRATSNNIEVDRLIGENSYALNDQGSDKLISKMIEAINKGFKGIHLNIEPHTFDDYKENIELYTSRLNTLYETAYNFCTENNLRLSVSIPIQLPKENIETLHRYKIHPYIMAYNKNQEKLLQKTAALRKTLNGNYTWVIRINDFSSEKELKKVENLLTAQGIKSIGYYELSMIK